MGPSSWRARTIEGDIEEAKEEEEERRPDFLSGAGAGREFSCEIKMRECHHSVFVKQRRKCPLTMVTLMTTRAEGEALFPLFFGRCGRRDDGTGDGPNAKKICKGLLHRYDVRNIFGFVDPLPPVRIWN